MSDDDDGVREMMTEGYFQDELASDAIQLVSMM